MKQYLDVLKKIMDQGNDRLDRTGVGTRALFCQQMRFNMADGFPAMTTKKLAFKQVKAELLWMISGSSDVKELQKLGCHIWDANANAPYWKPKAKFDGDLGRIYGVQWRRYLAPDGQIIDQLANVINQIKNDPYNRRHIVMTWNPGEIDHMALPPCHMFYQFFVAGGKLSIFMHQRSCDMFLGVPFNIASYSLLLYMVAQVTGLKPGEFVHNLGDVHVYKNHFEQVKKQLERKPLPLPQLWLNPKIKCIDDFGMEDIKLIGYNHQGVIKAPMAV